MMKSNNELTEKMFNRFGIKIKLISTIMLIGILSVFITGWQLYLSSKKTLEKVYSNQLMSIRETKRRHIETYFNQLRNQVITFSEDQMIIDAMNQFNTAFYNVKKDNYLTDSQIAQYELSLRDYYDYEYLDRLYPNEKEKREIEQYWPEGDEAIILQYHYIANNQNSVGSKDNLEMASDASQYSLNHSKYHPIIRNYMKKFGYYDIFLVDAKTGRVVYSVSKEVDFATSLLTGPYKDTNLARAFKEAWDAAGKEFVKLVDFEFYEPSYSYPASFIASPIFDGDKKIGVLVFEVPINEINKVMTGNCNWRNEGLGESGETYIVGSDYKMRNDSRFIIEEPDRYFELLEQIGIDKEVIYLINLHSTSVMFQEIRTEAVENALNGKKGTKIIDDYRGIPVLSSYTPLSVEDVKWVMLSEIDKKEVFASIYQLWERLFLIAVFISTLVTIIAFSFSESIAGPILQLIEYTETVAKGNLSKRVNITRKDEIGHLASSFNNMTLKLDESRMQLQESEKRKRLLLDSLKEGIYQCEPHVEGVFTWVNQACAEMFGYESSEDMVGTKVKDVYVDPDDRRKLVEKLENEGALKDLPTIFKRKNGECFYSERTTNMVKNKEGKPIRIEGIIRDVTERKQMEEELRISQKMSSVGRLTANVFHEILNPVNIISVNTQLLLLQSEKGSSTEKDLRTIQNGVERIVKITDDLLKFSSNEEHVAEEIDANSLLENTFSKIEPEMHLRSIKVTKKYEKELPKTMTYGNELKQVFLNVITNAIDAMPDGGTLTVKTRSVRSKKGNASKLRTQYSKLKGVFLEVSFADTGCGIAEKNIDKVFEPFFSTKREIKGVGLGLSFSYAIIEGCGGKMSVESEEGKGTMVKIYLPIKN